MFQSMGLTRDDESWVEEVVAARLLNRGVNEEKRSQARG